MPTLIRFVIVLAVLAALGFGGMVALAVFVDPGQKEMRVKIPSRDLGVEPNTDPLGVRPKPAAPAPVETETPAPEPIPAEPADDGSARTVDLPAE